MVSQQSSQGGKGKLNEGSLVVFDNTQRETKQRLLGYIDNMYSRIYMTHHSLHVLVETPLYQLSEEASKHHGTEISMSGLPSDDVLNQLYLMGLLKYDRYVAFLASKHSIDIDCFNSSALVSLDDLNGIKPEETKSKSTK